MRYLCGQGIVKAFGGVKAIRHLDIEFPRSGIIAIIGPNGAGKTTLINILTGFIPPDQGSVLFNGRDISHLPPYKIAKLGIARTFQDLRLILQISTIENVLLAIPNQRGEHFLKAIFRIGLSEEVSLNQDEAIRLLRLVGLEEKAFGLAGELSYGQQKLLTIACCLATKAPVIILDEPVAGVHPELIAHISSLLQDIKKEERLIIFIEHDLSVVREIADIVIVMDEGGIIAQGHPKDVLERPEIMEAYLA